MKYKRNFVIIIITCLLILTSCINKKTTFFIEGLFVASVDDVNFYLHTEVIEYDEYVKANGVNVLEDRVLKKKGSNKYYFKIEFYKLNGNEKVMFDFYNLSEGNPTTNAEPIWYKDINNNCIFPYFEENGNINSLYYMIRYDEYEINFERRI